MPKGAALGTRQGFALYPSKAGAFEIPFLNEGVGIGHSLGFPKGAPFGGFSKGNALGNAR
jgi:hypothetical protein